MEQERNDLRTGSEGDSLGMNKPFVFNCPYLGTLEDPDTSLAYPAPENHCFRVESPTAVDFSHQEAYCLADQHPGCHVFQMVGAATADAEPEAPPATPEKRNRRVSLFALPLILILILSAAIIWWPAPGTTTQEALVLGAQNDTEANGGATLNGKTDPQPSVAEEAVEVTSPDAAVDPVVTVTLNDSADQAEKEEPETSAGETEGISSADNDQIQASPATDIAPAPDQPPEAVEAPAQTMPVETPVETQTFSEETVSANSVQDTTTEPTGASPASPSSSDASSSSSDASSSSSDASSSSSEESPSSTAAEIISYEASDETGQANVTTEEPVENDEDTEPSPAVVTSDLPVISSTAPAAASAPAESVPTNAARDLVTLVGPVNNSPLSLRDSSKDVKVLSVYQDPSADSEPLSLIERRQFVTLLARDSSGAWLKVRLDIGVEGWINAIQSEAGVAVSSLPLEGDAIISGPAAEQVIPAATSYPVIRSAFVDTGALNVRSGPGVGYEPITIIDSGEIVGLIGRRALGPWVRVRLDSGLEGWVNSSLLAQVS